MSEMIVSLERYRQYIEPKLFMRFFDINWNDILRGMALGLIDLEEAEWMVCQAYPRLFDDGDELVPFVLQSDDEKIKYIESRSKAGCDEFSDRRWAYVVLTTLSGIYVGKSFHEKLSLVWADLDYPDYMLSIAPLAPADTRGYSGVDAAYAAYVVSELEYLQEGCVAQKR